MINNRKLFFLGIILITAGISIVITGGTMYFLLVSSSANKLRQSIGINDSNIITHTTVQTDKVVLEESSKIIDASKSAGKSVVSITGEGQATSDILGFGTIAPKTAGTGFIMTSDGLIATNKHVVSDDNAKYSVTTADNNTYDAKIVAKDPTNDIAFVKVDAHGLPVAELGDSDSTQVGEWVIAIGNALGELQNTVTVGVISAKERQANPSDSSTGATEALDGLLQTDAAINPGNSGGPLVNIEGKVIGINTAIVGDAQGIGFSMPITDLKKDFDSYQANGKIIQPYLGVRYQPITKALQSSLNLPVDKGALLTAQNNGSATVAGSPAAKAGLKSGDIITKVNTDAITESIPLTRLIRKYNPNQEITLTVMRDGKEIQVKVTLGTAS